MEKIVIELPVNGWNVVMQALARQPYGDVFDLIAEIKRQADEKLNSKSVGVTSDE